MGFAKVGKRYTRYFPPLAIFVAKYDLDRIVRLYTWTLTLFSHWHVCVHVHGCVFVCLYVWDSGCRCPLGAGEMSWGCGIVPHLDGTLITEGLVGGPGERAPSGPAIAQCYEGTGR